MYSPEGVGKSVQYRLLDRTVLCKPICFRMLKFRIGMNADGPKSREALKPMVSVVLHESVCNYAHKLRPVLHASVIRRKTGISRQRWILENFLRQCVELQSI